MDQTALIVAVPETEPAVERFRATLDRAAGWGVPAHVTVLYPFLPPDRVTESVVAVVGEAVATVPRFGVTFARTAWFGTDLLWLAPEPDDGFRALTAAVWQRFPETPPYAGRHGDAVPHLTVGHDRPLPLLRAAEDGIAPHLPIRAAVDSVLLIAGSTEEKGWRTLAKFGLGEG